MTVIKDMNMFAPPSAKNNYYFYERQIIDIYSSLNAIKFEFSYDSAIAYKHRLITLFKYCRAVDITVCDKNNYCLIYELSLLCDEAVKEVSKHRCFFFFITYFKVKHILNKIRLIISDLVLVLISNISILECENLMNVNIFTECFHYNKNGDNPMRGAQKKVSLKLGHF